MIHIDPAANSFVTIQKYNSPVVLRRWGIVQPLTQKLTFRERLFESIDPHMRAVDVDTAANIAIAIVENQKDTTKNRSVNIFDLKKLKEHAIDSVPFAGNSAALSPNGEYYTVDEGNGKFTVYLTNDGEILFQNYYAINNTLQCRFLFSQKGNILVTCNDAFEIKENDVRVPSDSLRIWDIESGMRISNIAISTANTSSFAISSDGSRLITITDGELRMWDTTSGKELFSIKPKYRDVLSGDNVWYLMFSPDGKHFVNTRQRDSSTVDIEYRSTADGSILYVFRTSAKVNNLSFSKDGNFLAVALGDGTARVWDVESRKSHRVLTHGLPVHIISFSKSGSYIATASNEDNLVRIWSLEGNQTEIGRVITNSNFIEKMEFCNQDRLLFTVSRLGIQKFKWMTDDLIKEVSSRLKNNIDFASWLKYLKNEPYRRTITRLPIGKLSANLDIRQADLLFNSINFSQEKEFAARFILWAIKNNNADLVRYSVKKGADPYYTINHNGYTTLGLAAYLGKLDAAKALIGVGVDVNLPNEDGVTPIVIAAYNSKFNEEDHTFDMNHAMMVKLLLDHGATVDLPQGEKNNDIDLVNAKKLLHKIIDERLWNSE
jgi:WD40 repeat protein